MRYKNVVVYNNIRVFVHRTINAHIYAHRKCQRTLTCNIIARVVSLSVIILGGKATRLTASNYSLNSNEFANGICGCENCSGSKYMQLNKRQIPCTNIHTLEAGDIGIK